MYVESTGKQQDNETQNSHDAPRLLCATMRHSRDYRPIEHQDAPTARLTMRIVGKARDREIFPAGVVNLPQSVPQNLSFFRHQGEDCLSFTFEHRANMRPQIFAESMRCAKYCRSIFFVINNIVRWLSVCSHGGIHGPCFFIVRVPNRIAKYKSIAGTHF